ncbi:MAG: ribonuclease D [Aquisalinus sp.]|nr:ribonuclease D [Aquisalinus sp.]
MQVITTTPDLESFCAALVDAPFITVDTEFMRERTYWSQLCLVQVASAEREAIIDPLADGLDLTPLLTLLANEQVIKVFHAARQDVEIFYKLMDVVPAPLFDTQVAAMACGYGDQIGYEPLVKAVTGEAIDKGSRFTDWSKRPLSDKQLTYALGDVTHLRDVYLALKGQLEKTGRLSWVEEEMNALLSEDLYFIKPENAWKRLKLRNVKRREIGPLMKVAEWREAEAQKRDVPRGRIIKDDTIYELSRQRPTTIKALGNCRSISKGYEASAQGKALLEAVQAGIDLPEEALPRLERQGNLPQVPADVLDMLRVLLKRQCEHHQVAPKLVASASDLETIARYDAPDVPAMKGWRQEIFGNAALDLKAGRLGLKLQDGNIEFIRLDS